MPTLRLVVENRTLRKALTLLALGLFLFSVLAPSQVERPCEVDPVAAMADDFCGVTPPDWVLQQAGHSCCETEHCRCDSKICGGSDTSIQAEAPKLPPPGERLPQPKVFAEASLKLRSFSYSVYLSPKSALAEPPKPPPPRLTV